ncbi:MAG: DUF4328 domain-containing protein, partial [Mycobacteriaceae bacterium]|nr:DUF4328 domain-containing protein [Mycobacteriaceae bacterium]
PKATRPARLGQTPRYRVIPQWGLPDPPPAPPTVDKGDAASAPRLLGYVAAAYLAAAAAEFGRYLILLRNRTRLIDPWLLRLSDLTVLACSLLALTLAVVTAVVCVRALTEIRRAVFDAAGRSDPRSARQIALWCLVPGLNLVGPGLLLTEPARLVAPRALRAVRIWWGAWVLSAGIALTAFLWRWADSLQAMANGVAFTALADLAAAGVAVTTLWVMRELKGRNLIGRSPIPTRRVPAVGPVRPVIAEVRPAEPGEPSDSTSSTGNDDADRTDGRAAQEAAAS